jgi:hypothetical protein
LLRMSDLHQLRDVCDRLVAGGRRETGRAKH